MGRGLKIWAGGCVNPEHLSRQQYMGHQEATGSQLGSQHNPMSSMPQHSINDPLLNALSSPCHKCFMQ